MNWREPATLIQIRCFGGSTGKARDDVWESFIVKYKLTFFFYAEEKYSAISDEL